MSTLLKSYFSPVILLIMTDIWVLLVKPSHLLLKCMFQVGAMHICVTAIDFSSQYDYWTIYCFDSVIICVFQFQTAISSFYRDKKFDQNILLV